MYLQLDTIKNKLNNNDISWFTKGGNKSRIRSFLKKNTLDDSLIKQLWEIRSLRYDLITTQKLDKKAVIQIILDINHKNINITKAMYIATLVNQKLDSFIIKTYIENDDLNYQLYLLAWASIPKTMLQYAKFDLFLDRINNSEYLAYLKEKTRAVVAIARKTDKLKELINFFCSYPNQQNIEYIITLSKLLYFTDDIITIIYDKLDNGDYNNIMAYLTSKDNCSINMKAKFLLEK